MVESNAVLINVQGGKKIGELTIGFTRLPFVTNQNLLEKFRSELNKELVKNNARVSETAYFRSTSSVTEEIVFDVYQWASPSLTATAIIAILALIVVSLVCIVMYVKYEELQAVIADIGRDIETVIASKEAALAEGKIDVDVAERLNKVLAEAKRKADEAGRDDWWNFLGEALQLLPLVLIGLGALIILPSILPRRREE